MGSSPPRLALAQEEAHSVFARASIQRQSIAIGRVGLSKGGSTSLLNLLAADSEERSVRRGVAFSDLGVKASGTAPQALGSSASH